MKRLLSIAFCVVQTTVVCLAEDWMGQLDDNAYLAQISIPGTHDSATGEGWTGFLGEFFGSSMGVTQDLTIAQQLDCGVRAFDLRPCVVDNELVINHGILQTKAKFPETMKLLCSFVTKHPTEFVVVVMRHETDGDDNSTKWRTMMNSCLNGSDLRPMLADYKRDITVGELRGKVLVLSRDSYATKPVGGIISGWGHQMDYVQGTIKGPDSTGKLFVQDFYEVLENTSGKVAGIVKLLDFSTKNNVNKNIQHLTVCINHTSGYTSSASTDGNRDNAAICNQTVIDYLADGEHAGPTGIVFADFAGTNTSDDYQVRGLDLVNVIISNNKRYAPVKKEESQGIASRISLDDQMSSRYDLQGLRLDSKASRTIGVERGKKIIVK